MPTGPAPDPSITRPPCTPARRCRDWRTCPHCARARQARVADAVERLAALYPHLHWTVLRPLRPEPAALSRLRLDWLRQAAPPGAIWTIETGQETRALHANLIHPPLRNPSRSR